jgi:hypothetical protein
MSTYTFYRWSGVSLVLGGAVAALAHIFHPMDPTDPSMLSHYASVSQPAHLLLFAGTVFVLLALPGFYLGLGESGGVLAFVGSFLLYFGILFADALHCILEFSVFPVLMRSVPYVTISIAETTYAHTPLAILQAIGEDLVFVGAPLLAVAVMRSRVLSSWAAAPLLLTVLLMVASVLPWTARIVGRHYVTSLYLALMVLGVAVVFGTRPPVRQ